MKRLFRGEAYRPYRLRYSNCFLTQNARNFRETTRNYFSRTFVIFRVFRV
ncbi:MAG: hypothetical protein LBJ00_05690 [Planctomycetaceae bacterium]|nr:hypothetical protein [Planctomycetaceae bacterium]